MDNSVGQCESTLLATNMELIGGTNAGDCINVSQQGQCGSSNGGDCSNYGGACEGAENGGKCYNTMENFQINPGGNGGL